MASQKLTISKLKPDIQVTTSRSSGPGGQHANKVETKVTLRFNVKNSSLLSEMQRDTLLEKLGNRINQEGELILSSDSQRSQLRNKELAFKLLDRLIKKAFIIKKKRKRTKPGKAAIAKRLKGKKMQSEKKKLRQKL